MSRCGKIGMPRWQRIEIWAETVALLPVARLKQVAQWVAEAREQVLPFEEAAAADELSAGRSAADLCALGVRINDPRKLCAAFEEVLEPLVNFGAGVIWRKDFHGQIGRAGKKSACRALETERNQPFPADKRDVRRAAVPVLHPEACAGVQDGSGPFRLDESPHRRQQLGANVTVEEIILGTHNQFAVDDFMDVSVLRQRLQLRLGPDLPGRLDYSAHRLRVRPPEATVEPVRACQQQVPNPRLRTAAPDETAQNVEDSNT